MGRRVGMFSAGAASAVACLIADPPLDVIVYCETGSEHEDNERFIGDCEAAFGWQVKRLRNPKFADTWAVWEWKQYIGSHMGAPCTSLLKMAPRIAFQKPDDTKILGYTADRKDSNRAARLRKNFFEETFEFPLIDRGITKQGCLSLLERRGVAPPLTYAQGLPHANCIPCCKSESPAYWALIRKLWPDKFERMAKLARKLNNRMVVYKGERIWLEDLPEDVPTTQPVQPRCDFLCELADMETDQ